VSLIKATSVAVTTSCPPRVWPWLISESFIISGRRDRASSISRRMSGAFRSVPH
jgi:hypothetical protein